MYMEIENRKVRTAASRNNGKLGGRPKTTQEKPMGFNLVNLKETYNKPNNNLSGTGTGNENETVDEYENESENVNVSETNILKRYLDDLIQYEDNMRFKRTWEEVEDYGGLNKVFDSLSFSESQRLNWERQINNVRQFM